MMSFLLRLCTVIAVPCLCLILIASSAGKAMSGRQLVYFQRSFDVSRLYTLAVEQGIILHLFDNVIDPNHLALIHLAPDTDRVVFTSSLNSLNSDLYVIDMRNQRIPRRLTNYPTVDTDPLWSPDGESIAFVSTRSNDDNLYIIDRVNDGIENGINNGRLLTSQPGINIDYAPSWSPDGRYLAFISQREGNFDIYVVDVFSETNEERRLTDHPASDLDPVWSPDGEHIAFVSRRDGNANIYVIASDGGGSAVRMTQGLFNVYNPAWSPDGRYIAFAAKTDLDGNMTNDIYAVHVADRQLIRLTQHPANDNTPVWSPDGEQIAFISWRDGTADVYSVRIDQPLYVERLTISRDNAVSFVWR